MINFRYHVVSLTAVFLALAIGLVVGTAALNGPVADSLKDRVNGLSKHNEQLREAVNNLETEVKREEDFLTEAAPHILKDTLADRRVLLFTLPSGQEHADGIAEMLRMGGATITGRIDVQEKFIDPDNSVLLLGVAAKAARPTVPDVGLPSSEGVEKSSALLASALLDRPEGGSPVTDADRRSVLDDYSDEGYLNVPDKISGPAEAVVLVSGPPYVDRDATRKDRSVVQLAEQFDRAGALVVAGNGSSGGNLVAEVRRDPALAKTISTVDNANTVAGQVVTALAVVQQLTQKRAGAYGVGASVDSLLPERPE
ncbi:copper transporter [Plantactinospora sp. WMMC1484]|uniref:copper transporter n=1 Tax=Plantactinospora sp. WMMC1484 TaxID=3404122 RepID=UPI003BF50F1F